MKANLTEAASPTFTKYFLPHYFDKIYCSLKWNVPIADVDRASKAAVESKRIFDFIFAAASLVVLLPLLVLIALCILIVDGRPIWLRQKRVSRGGRLFECLKFRTMVLDFEQQLQELLRSSEIDREEWSHTR